ncbi:MAG: M13 family peptidase, partial [Candidatus Methylacidiphilales bacterium]
MRIKHYLLLTSAVCALTTSAQDGKKAKKNAKKPAIDKSTMDLSVKPNQNFYQYANGTWLKNNPVPSTESRWGNFNIVAERNNDILRGILENLAKTT